MPTLRDCQRITFKKPAADLNFFKDNVKALETAAHQKIKLKVYLRRAFENSDSNKTFPVPLNILIGSVIVLHSYNYISLFLPCFEIAVRLRGLVQRKTPVDHRFYLARLNQLFDKYKVRRPLR